MQGQQEVEEILEQAVWADRNGLDYPAMNDQRGAYLPPAQMLREHELRTYRDCPAADAYDDLPVVPLGWTMVGWFAVAMLVAFAIWSWPHTH